MTATAIRQATGWWANLCRAECARCAWHGPVRDANSDHENTLLKLDRNEHRCGTDSEAEPE